MMCNSNSLTEITIPDSVKTLGNSAFAGSANLEKIKLSEGLTSFGNSVFSSCYSLKSVTIPKSVTSLGDGVFGYCYDLKYVDFSNHDLIPTLGKDAFNYVTDFQIIVPDDLYETWVSAKNWDTYADYIVKASEAE